MNDIQSLINLIGDASTINENFAEVAKRINKLQKTTKSNSGKIFVLQFAVLGGIWVVTKLTDKIDKLNARVIALESEKDFVDMEKHIRES